MAGDFDLTITGGQVVTTEKVAPATIAVAEGRIAGLFDAREHPAARAHMDARGLHILPGLIDTHVHIRAPARPDREDFVSGTSAAAAGGITTLLEMPISEPPVNSAAVLSHRMTQLEPHALIDFGLYGSISPDNMEEIPRMAEAGAVAFKTFMTLPPPGREEEFVGLCCPNVADLYDLMRTVAQTNLLHCFHCEHAGLLDLFLRKVQASGETKGIAHARSAPPIVEDLSVAGILVFAELFRNRVQIVHLSSHKAAQLVKEAKAKGVNVSVETCPQYLFLTMEELNRHGPFAKCNPALRTADEVEQLWPYLLDGTIDVIGTDHSPYIPSEKEVGQDDIFRATAGVPGLEAMLPLMLTAVNQGRLTLPALARLMSHRAAQLFCLKGKGQIAPDHDADLTLVDLNRDWTFDRHRTLSKGGRNMHAYHGRALRGQVATTMVRGQVVYADGQIVMEPGHGRCLRPGT